MATFPPMDASTWARSVVGSWTKGIPRMYVAATNPARSPTAPPPSARSVEVRSRPAARQSSQQRSATARVLAVSPSPTPISAPQKPGSAEPLDDDGSGECQDGPVTDERGVPPCSARGQPLPDRPEGSRPDED